VMGFKLDPFCSRSFEHCQVPFGAGSVEAKNIQTIIAPDLDVAVVRSAPLIECFENIDSVPIEMKSPRHRHAVIRGMLLDLNAHDLGPWGSVEACTECRQCNGSRSRTSRWRLTIT